VAGFGCKPASTETRVLAPFDPHWSFLNFAVAPFAMSGCPLLKSFLGSSGPDPGRIGKYMDQQIDTDLDQADEEILTDTVSDEALEAADGARLARHFSCHQLNLLSFC
jgi:hypothetical protein